MEHVPASPDHEQIAALACHPSSSEQVEKKAHYLLRRVSKTIRDYDMIHGGDRVAVAISGGKDSLSMLDLLVRHRAKAKDKYELAAIHVASEPPCGGCLSVPDMRVLCEEGYGIPLSIEPVAEEDLRGGKRDEITCFGCAFQRRKALFIAAHRMGCNRIAFAHHRDDAATTAMLNLFRHGTLVGLEPVRVMFGGALTLIRPLIAVDERRLEGVQIHQHGYDAAQEHERLRLGERPSLGEESLQALARVIAGDKHAYHGIPFAFGKPVDEAGQPGVIEPGEDRGLRFEPPCGRGRGSRHEQLPQHAGAAVAQVGHQQGLRARTPVQLPVDPEAPPDEPSYDTRGHGVRSGRRPSRRRAAAARRAAAPAAAPCPPRRRARSRGRGAG